MKLARLVASNRTFPALLHSDGSFRDISSVLVDITATTIGEGRLEHLREVDIGSLPVASTDAQFAPCVGQSPKFICVGLNYHDHAEEAGILLPAEPVLFMKATSAISSARSTLQLPRFAHKVDWEVELGLIIGKRANWVPESEALSHVAGYCIVNDISERAFQLERGGQWVKGKSADGFGPIGPWLVTPDELPDVQSLDLWLEVNGVRKQAASTSRMIFSVRYLISYISQFMTLMPGDIISTGTPAGVGMGQKPPQFLQVGDVVKASIEGLGVQQLVVVDSMRGL